MSRRVVNGKEIAFDYQNKDTVAVVSFLGNSNDNLVRIDKTLGSTIEVRLI